MIVYTPGVWDVLHYGHIKIISKAKEYGNILVVGVCSDRLSKLHGKDVTMNEQDRATLLSSLRWVDQAYIYDNPDQTETLKLFNVDVFVIGEEFGKQNVPEHALALEYCKQNNIQVIRLPRSPGVSSSELKKRINDKHREQVIKTFWQSRAEHLKNNSLGLFQSTSLTTTEQNALARKETDLQAILQCLAKSSHKRGKLLDVGCGVGRITVELASIYESIHAVDYIQDFIDAAKQKEVTNVQWQCAEVHEFVRQPYDCCLMAGLLICLSDEKINQLLDAIQYIPVVVLKESVGTFGRFELSYDHYSDELKSNYTGIYRSPWEIMEAFNKRGYVAKYTEIIEMHRKETNLQVFLFEKK